MVAVEHKFVDHKLVYFVFFIYICTRKDVCDMNIAFVYGMSVEGDNFTDRVNETKRLKMDFENGINVILVSPRRIGKSSIVRKVMNEITDPKIKTVFIDIYDCRSEYDFYNRFASAIGASSIAFGSRDLWASPEKRLRLGIAQASLALHSPRAFFDLLTQTDK